MTFLKQNLPHNAWRGLRIEATLPGTDGKGFILAELLIVVAIIAVLVAIAVPLFVSALDKAEKGVFEANQRSLKGMAVTEILTNDDLLYDETTGALKGTWYATGKLDANGNLSLTGWEKTKETTFDDYKKVVEGETDEGKHADGSYIFTVKIDKSDIEAYKKSD